MLPRPESSLKRRWIEAKAKIAADRAREPKCHGPLNHACVWWPILPVSAHSPYHKSGFTRPLAAGKRKLSPHLYSLDNQSISFSATDCT